MKPRNQSNSPKTFVCASDGSADVSVIGRGKSSGGQSRNPVNTLTEGQRRELVSLYRSGAPLCDIRAYFHFWSLNEWMFAEVVTRHDIITRKENMRHLRDMEKQKRLAMKLSLPAKAESQPEMHFEDDPRIAKATTRINAVVSQPPSYTSSMDMA